jgi:hypothetical protein
MLKNLCHLFILSLLHVSCKDQNESPKLYKEFDECLLLAGSSIQNHNEAVLQAMNERLRDPLTHTKAEMWHPKIARINELSKAMCTYINGLKKELKAYAQIQSGSGSEGFEPHNRAAVYKVFIENNRGDELYRFLKQYEQQILSVDTVLKGYCKSNPVFRQLLDPTVQNASGFTDRYFTNLSSMAALTMLSKFQTDVGVVQNRTSLFCLEQSTSNHIGPCSYLSAIIAQSSSVVQRGKEVEISAGVGAFRADVKPKIFIDGKEVPLNDMAYACFKFKAPVLPGKYKKKVEISFNDQDGKKQIVTKDVGYTVADY